MSTTMLTENNILALDLATSISERVRDHLIAHRARSVEEHDSSQCLYRSPEGHSCAVGILIPDEMYRPDMEGLEANGALVSDAVFAATGISNLYTNGQLVILRLLMEWQRYHDSNDCVPPSFAEIAYQEYLDGEVASSPSIAHQLLMQQVPNWILDEDKYCDILI